MAREDSLLRTPPFKIANDDIVSKVQREGGFLKGLWQKQAIGALRARVIHKLLKIGEYYQL